MNYSNTPDFALKMDALDDLLGFRSRFYFPRANGKEILYFCGNSLGLQPRSARDFVLKELDNWASHAVEGHFKIEDPWLTYHEILKESSARIVGAKPSEVVIMNSLTVNLHLLMVSFYRPDKKRCKILCEAGAFPSDQYALESQVKFHGLDPEEAIVELKPRAGEHTLRNEDILGAIEQHADELSLVMIGGVNYYTGQAFDMKSITEAGHRAGAIVGFDLAHAAGNILLRMHDWNVDFAAWCSYKYLNSGPGSVAGAFIHERHARRFDLPRFAGWFGNDVKTRFKMQRDFEPAEGADGWNLSNSHIFSMAVLRSSLQIFDEAGMERLAAKRDRLTGYLEFILDDINRTHERKEMQIITPREAASRGAQLSLLLIDHGKEIYSGLGEQGVMVDWREPNVIRISPVPLYNSFEDVYKLGQVLDQVLSQN
jgi:kynureninase